MYSSLISPKIINEHLEDPNWRFFDCRYVLTEPDKKQAEFAESHLQEQRMHMLIMTSQVRGFLEKLEGTLYLL